MVCDVISDLVAEWKFSNNFNDSSGNGYTLTNSGGTATFTTDKNSVPNQAVLINSSDNLTTTLTLAGENKVTLSAWMNASSWSSQTGWLIGKISGINDRFGIGFISGTCYILAENGGPGFGSISVSGLSTGWHHFTLEYDGTQATNPTKLKLYIDNVIQTLVYNGTFSTTIASTDNFSIGTWDGVGTLSASVDEERVYTRILDEDSRLALFEGYDAPSCGVTPGAKIPSIILSSDI